MKLIGLAIKVIIMRTSKLFIVGILCFSTLGLVSCGDKTEDSPYTELTPDEHKAKLEEIGLSIADKVNPEVQKNLVKTFDAFIEYSDGLDIEDNNDEIGGNVQNLAKTLKNICKKNSLGKVGNLSRAADSELYSLARYAGIYTFTGEDEYGYYDWEKTDASDKLEFRFKTDNKDAVIQITKEGTEQQFDAYDDGTSYSVMVPEIAKVTVTYDGKSELTLVCKMKVDNSAKTVVSDITVDANGYKYEEHLDVNSSKASTNLTFSIDGIKIVEAYASINGKDMTNGDVIGDNVDNETIQNLFGDGQVEVKVYGDNDGVILKGSVSSVKELIDRLDRLDNVDWEEENTMAHQTKIAEAYNEYLKGEMYYTNGDNVIARFNMQAYDDSDEWGEYYDIEPIITFMSDDSKFSFESYFDDISFEKLVDKVEDLGDEFDAYIDFN